MIEAIQEKVEVVTIFRLKPAPQTVIHRIRWRGRVYPITKIAYHYKLWEGRNRLHKFALSSETLDFRLTYDTENLFWFLEEVSDGFS
jgi:hypothetical protein